MDPENKARVFEWATDNIADTKLLFGVPLTLLATAPSDDYVVCEVGTNAPGEIIRLAGTNRAPHALVHYLRELANSFHTYYNAEQFIVDDAALRNARLSLVLAVRQVIRNGLTLLGVSAPDTM
jgi:hypothetical protein